MENINHLDYYKNADGKECIDVMEEVFGISQLISFCKIHAFKYRWRAGNKPGNSKEKDLAKADWYETKVLQLENKLYETEKGKESTRSV